MRATTHILLAIAATCIPAAPVSAADARFVEAELLTIDGDWLRGRVVSVGADGVSLDLGEGTRGVSTIDAGRIISIGLRERLSRPIGGLRAPAPPRLAAVTGVLELVDGQAFPGTSKLIDGRLAWDHRWLGEIPIDIERTARLRLVSARTIDRGSDADRVLLTNGDVIEGIVERIGPDMEIAPLAGPMSSKAAPQPVTKPAQQSERAGEGAPDAPPAQEQPALRRLSLDRVAVVAFILGDGSSALPDGAARVRSIDGTTVHASDIRFDPESGWNYRPFDSTLPPMKSEIAFGTGLADPVGIAFAPDRSIDLCAREPNLIEVPDGQFAYDISQSIRREVGVDALGLGSLVVESPLRVRWEVPAGFQRPNGRVVASIDISSEFSDPSIGQMEVTLGAGTSPATTARIGPLARSTTLRIEIDATRDRTIELTVRDGGDGPIGDRLRLDRAVLVASDEAPKPTR